MYIGNIYCAVTNQSGAMAVFIATYFSISLGRPTIGGIAPSKKDDEISHKAKYEFLADSLSLPMHHSARSPSESHHAITRDFISRKEIGQGGQRFSSIGKGKTGE